MLTWGVYTYKCQKNEFANLFNPPCNERQSVTDVVNNVYWLC